MGTSGTGTGATGGIAGGTGTGAVAGSGVGLAGTGVGMAGAGGIGAGGIGAGGIGAGGIGAGGAGAMGLGGVGPGAGGMAGLGVGGMMPPVVTGPPASGIELVKLDANQAVGVPLFKGGRPTTAKQRKAVIVGGRGMLMRAYWKLGPGWTARMIKGVLTVRYLDGSMKQVVDDKQIAGKGDPKKMAGAFNFRLEKADVREGMEVQVELFEAGPPMGAPPPVPPRIPAIGTLPVPAKATPSLFAGVMVPFLGLNGETPAPSATPAQLKNLSDFLYDIYPVQDVKLEVVDPIRPTEMQGMAPSSSTQRAPYWYALHKLCTQMGRGPGVLYQGVVNASIMGIGVSGSSLGRGAPIDPSQPCRRKTVIAVNYSSASRGMFPNQVDGKPSTTAHEWGHNLGRPHSPGCGASNTDTMYPHGEGLLGTQGFRMTTEEFFHSPKHKDVMTYCYCTTPDCGSTPRWISDYVYNSIYQTTTELTKFIGTTPKLHGRSVVGFIEPGFSGMWLNSAGQMTDDDDVPTPTQYAVVWVRGQPSPHLAVTVDVDSEGLSSQVSFNLPPGPTPDYAVVVVDGIMRPIDMRFIDRADAN
ncbi:MAG: hypothetical protein MJD61_15935 [Proteobacteria bacterium]|nr:hypothetical protein [Pseudomonadota bacterium]